MSTRRKFILGATALLGTVLGLGAVRSAATPAAQKAEGCECPCCCCEECTCAGGSCTCSSCCCPCPAGCPGSGGDGASVK